MIFFDLETTGLDVNNDRIVQICMIPVQVENKSFVFNRDDAKTRFVNPQMPIPPGATEVHGIDDGMVKNEPTFKQISKGILNFLGGHKTIVGFNSNFFDVPLLNAEFERAGLEWNWGNHIFLDAGNLYRINNPRTLAAAYENYAGKPMPDAHDALGDVLGTIKVMSCILDDHYEEFDLNDPFCLSSLALIGNYDVAPVDLAGFFKYDSDGHTVIFAKGKHKNKKAKDCGGYLAWMINSGTFSKDTTRVCIRLLEETTEDKREAERDLTNRSKE